MTRRPLKLIAALALVVLAAPGLASAEPGDLERAYKKEFTYLEAQKRALSQRLEQVKREEVRKIKQAQDEVDRLQGRLLSMTVQADRVEAELLDAERQVGTITDREDTLATTIEQARATLKNHAVTLPEVEAQEDDPGLRARQQSAALAAGVDGALGLLERWQGVRREPGEFFLADGTKVQGQLVRVGQVAAYGVSARGAGALAPAGGGQLKLWSKDDASASARALSDPSAPLPETIGVFLFESLDKNIEEKQARTWLETIQLGGLVAWVIVGLGALGVLLVLARAALFLWSGAGTRRLLDELEGLVQRGELEAALKRCAASRGASARVLGATVRGLQLERAQAEDVVAEAIMHESPRYERFGTAIMVFAAVAPLLGLLGTVTGMISTFDIITEFGTGDPKMLSGGISEALITTELGLIVAIPMLLLGNMTNGAAEAKIAALERGALRLINAQALRALPQPGASKAASSAPTDDDDGAYVRDAVGAL